jgi:hypothetical protein
MVYSVRTNKPLVTKRDLREKRKRKGDWKNIDELVYKCNVSIDKDGNVRLVIKNA